MKDMRMLVTTCDPYKKHLRITLHQLQKYWSPLPSIDILGFAPPDFDLPEGTVFISAGDMKDYPINKWSDPVIEYFKQTDTDRVIWFLDDYFLYRKVDTRAVEVLWDYASQFKFVEKIDLAEDRLHAKGTDMDYSYIDYDDGKRLDLIKGDPTSEYFSSLWPGIFSVEHLLRVMIPGETPWNLELDGTYRLRNMTDIVVLGTKQSLVEIRLGARGGKGAGEISIDGLRIEDQIELRELGLI